MTNVEHLNDDEINYVAGGVISALPVRYEIDIQTGQLVGYDSNGNVVSNDPTKIN